MTYRERKTGVQVVIGLHQDFLDWLSERPVPEQSDAFVFPELAGRPLAGDGGLSATFRKLVKKAGIENRFLRSGTLGLGNRVYALTFHSLRHNAASSVFNSAVAPKKSLGESPSMRLAAFWTVTCTGPRSIRQAVNLIPRLPL